MNLTHANIWEVIDEAQKTIVKQFPGDNSIAQKMALKELEKMASSDQSDEEKKAAIYAKFISNLSQSVAIQKQSASIDLSIIEESSTSTADDHSSETNRTTIKSLKKDEPIDAEEQFQLGKRYFEGNGVFKDEVEAAKWFRLAAEQGHVEAQLQLGLFYHKGFGGVIKNDAQAVIWYQKAAEQGNAEAQNNLGMRYNRGEGVYEDKAEAVKWFRLAAEQGYAKAQFNLGVR